MSELVVAFGVFRIDELPPVKVVDGEGGRLERTNKRVECGRVYMYVYM